MDVLHGQILRVLGVLLASDEPLRLHQIAYRAGVKYTSLASYLGRLEKAELIGRELCDGETTWFSTCRFVPADDLELDAVDGILGGLRL